MIKAIEPRWVKAEEKGRDKPNQRPRRESI